MLIDKTLKWGMTANLHKKLAGGICVLTLMGLSFGAAFVPCAELALILGVLATAMVITAIIVFIVDGFTRWD